MEEHMSTVFYHNKPLPTFIIRANNFSSVPNNFLAVSRFLASVYKSRIDNSGAHIMYSVVWTRPPRPTTRLGSHKQI